MDDILYTVTVGGELWTDVIDDMHRNEPWAVGGMIFTSKEHAEMFAEHLQHPNYKEYCNGKAIEIKAVQLENIETGESLHEE